MDYVRKENEFSIYLYCLEKDIDFKRDKKKGSTRLCYKHGLCYNMCYGQIKWELPTEKKNNFNKIKLSFNVYFYFF